MEESDEQFFKNVKTRKAQREARWKAVYDFLITTELFWCNHDYNGCACKGGCLQNEQEMKIARHEYIWFLQKRNKELTDALNGRFIFRGDKIFDLENGKVANIPQRDDSKDTHCTGVFKPLNEKQT